VINMRLVCSSLAIVALVGLAIAAPTVSADPLAPVSAPSVLGSVPATSPEKAGPPLSSPTVLVKASSLETAQAIATRHHLTLSRSFPWIDWYELATAPGTTDAAAAKAALDADPDVADTDAVAADEQGGLALTPQDPVWAADALASGETQTWNLERANFPAAWVQARGGGTRIGIIDSEFDTQHPDLKAKFTEPWNLASGTLHYRSGNVQPDLDTPLHGTHVAGIAGAFTNNNVGISGAGFDAAIIPVRINTFASGGGNPVDARFVGDLTEALGYMIAKNPTVVNISLGTTFPHAPLQDVLRTVQAKGITVVAAAGNQQAIAPNDPIYPASYDGVVAVANTRSDDSLAPDSSNGGWVDVAAPGTNIVSTWGDGSGLYAVASGTSMAAPLVSGLVALMKSVRPDLTPAEVEMLLKSTAHDLGIPGPDSAFGAGLVNAAAAVDAAAAYVRPVPPAPPAPPPPPPPPPPPADTVSPKVSIKGLVTLAGRSVTVRFTCAEDCSGRVRLRTASRRLLTSKSFKSAKAGKTVTVRLKTKKRLKSRSTVIIEIAARDAAGNLATKAERRKLRK
jgi:subtilisin family serine protease